MSVVERIIQERKERKARRDAAIAAVMRLPVEDRQEVLAELIDLVEREATPQVPGVAEPSHPPQKRGDAKDSDRPETFTDKAEAFVQKHPQGVTTAEVARAIGQKVESVDGTLRSVMKVRRSIERRDGKWFPKTPEAQAKRVTHRDIIAQVMTTANRAIGAGDIIGAVQAIDPERKRESLEAELHRMREDGVISQKGSNGRGSLYVLSNGGTSGS